MLRVCSSCTPPTLPSPFSTTSRTMQPEPHRPGQQHTNTKALRRPLPAPPPSFAIKFRTSPFSRYKECVIRPLSIKPKLKQTKARVTPSSTNDSRAPPLWTTKRALPGLDKDRKNPQDSSAEGRNPQADLSLNSYLVPETDWTVSKQPRTEVRMSVPTGAGRSFLDGAKAWEGAEIGMASAGGRARRRNSQLERKGSFMKKRKSVAGSAQKL